MPVKRALQLEVISEENEREEMIRKKIPAVEPLYSPTTGTCRLHGPSTPDSKFEERLKKAGIVEINDEKKLTSRWQAQPPVKENLMVLHSKMEASLSAFTAARKNLKALKALEGSRKLENIIGHCDTTSDLRAEVQRSKGLLLVAEVQKKRRQKNITPYINHEHVQQMSTYDLLISTLNPGKP
ncbi:centromere protein R [Protopterus annectens]|uniref:centromere protein R n=1 Tax=Protopterus annectens TaxID=7888 RepID=UPI001CF973EB|nr:centromere protein R [Protopterus annectens]